MNIDELKKKCLSVTTCNEHEKNVTFWFKEFKQSNKIDCDPDTNYVMKFELEEIKKSITCLDNRIDNRGDSLDNKINLLEKEIETLKKMFDNLADRNLFKSGIDFVNAQEKPVSEPKQERFYYVLFENYNRQNPLYKYQIYDSKFKTFNPEGLCSESMAIDLCKHLNSLEAKT